MTAVRHLAVKCPAHHNMVGVDEHGHLTGRCDQCVAEAARAQRLIELGLDREVVRA